MSDCARSGQGPVSTRYGEVEVTKPYRRRQIAKAINVSDIKNIARSKMPKLLFDFVEGGVEDELCLATNASAFERVRLLPRYGTDTSKVSLKTTVFGKQFSSPFGISPMGFNALYRRHGDQVLANAARDAGIPFTLSTASNSPIETVAEIGNSNLWFQLYGTRNRDIAKDLVRRAEMAGITTLLMTIDVPVTGRRERNMRNGLAIPFKPKLRDVVDAALRPEWLFNYLRSGTPTAANWPPYVRDGSSQKEIWTTFNGNMFDSSQTWDDVQRIRDIWPHNFLVKGVLSPDDARRTVSLGADGLIISNHGGRQLDRAPATIDMLPQIRAAVGPDFTVMLDSGIRRGTDIVAALCLGADFVLMGRSALYGLMAGGEEGVRKVISILREEMLMAMGQIGCNNVSHLGAKFVMKTDVRSHDEQRAEVSL